MMEPFACLRVWWSYAHLCRKNTKSRSSNMSTVQMHYDGWITLPAVARQKFGLTTGDRLEIEFADEAIVLRPARGSAAPERAIAEPAPVEAEEPIAAAAPPPVVKRGPGRPR